MMDHATDACECAVGGCEQSERLVAVLGLRRAYCAAHASQRLKRGADVQDGNNTLR